MAQTHTKNVWRYSLFWRTRPEGLTRLRQTASSSPFGLERDGDLRRFETRHIGKLADESGVPC